MTHGAAPGPSDRSPGGGAVLPPEEVARLSRLRSDRKGLVQLALHASLYLLGASLSTLGYRWAGLAVMSLAVGAVFMVVHETVHGTAFRTPALNSAVAWAAGFVCARPPRHYRYYHYAHHAYVGQPSRDPELFDSMLDPSLTTAGSYALYLSGVPYWVDRVGTLLRHAALGRASFDPAKEYYLVPPRPARETVLEARAFVLAYAAVLWLLPAAALWRFWGAPSLVGQALLRFYLLHEHWGCARLEAADPSGGSREADAARSAVDPQPRRSGARDVLRATRSTRMPAWVSWLAWQMPYHAEHHAYPSVPFHLLGEVHRQVGDRASRDGGCDPGGERGLLAVHSRIVGRLFGA